MEYKVITVTRASTLSGVMETMLNDQARQNWEHYNTVAFENTDSIHLFFRRPRNQTAPLI
ncbi:MAG: hypothetical protein FWD01_03870 [Defluviitaleaceae bacterium]|nr:hypothetical protein [Defluviitaleaceae bacterium]